MAVRNDDAMTAEGRRQRPRARRRHGMCDPELLDGDARPGHLTCKPALAASRHEHHALHARGLQVHRQFRDHALSAAWTIRFDQVRDAQSGEPGCHPDHARASTLCRPTARATRVYSISEYASDRNTEPTTKPSSAAVNAGVRRERPGRPSARGRSYRLDCRSAAQAAPIMATYNTRPGTPSSAPT